MEGGTAMGPHLPTSFCHQGLHPQAQLGEGAPLEENHTSWGPVGACLSQRILGVFWVEVPMPVVGWQLGRCGNQSAGLWGLQCQQTAPSPAVWCTGPACELGCLTHCPRGLAMEQGGTGLLGPWGPHEPCRRPVCPATREAAQSFSFHSLEGLLGLQSCAETGGELVGFRHSPWLPPHQVAMFGHVLHAKCCDLARTEGGHCSLTAQEVRAQVFLAEG